MINDLKILQELGSLSELVEEYRTMPELDGDYLNYLLQKISGTLFFLETVRSETHDNFQREIFELTKQGKTVARAENSAHEKYPLMYRLRRVMDGGYEIIGAIRTNISFLKSERQTTRVNN